MLQPTEPQTTQLGKPLLSLIYYLLADKTYKGELTWESQLSGKPSNII